MPLPWPGETHQHTSLHPPTSPPGWLPRALPGQAAPLEAQWFSLSRCWITSKHLLVHYITNCGYFGLIFLFNMAVFGVVVRKSCCLRVTGAVQGDHSAWKVALVAMALFCLLGATWALAFLTHGTSSAPVLYLFTVLNSLQGQGSLGVGGEDGEGRRQPGRGSRGTNIPPVLPCPSLCQGASSSRPQPQAWGWARPPASSTPAAVVFLQGSHSSARDRGHYPLRATPGQRAHLQHGEPSGRNGSELAERPRSGSEVPAASRQDAPHHLLLLLSVCLPSPAGIFIFVWLVVLYRPKVEETTGSLSRVFRLDKTTTVSQD